MQRARERARRRAARVERAVEEEPVRLEHVEVVVLPVVRARGEIGEKALEVVDVRGVGAELWPHGREYQVDVAQVAEQEGAHLHPLVVGELGGGKDGVALLLGPSLLVLAADEVHHDCLSLQCAHGIGPKT